MRHLTAADYLRTRWKNGGGETVQLAIFPEGASLDDFAWRISMAAIDRDGPFSLFAGVDRSLAVLDGDGVVLHIDGKRHQLAAGGEPLRFGGDARTAAELISGPVRDFNVMTRRGVAGHRLGVMREGDKQSAASGLAAIFAVGDARVLARDAVIELGPHELLVLDPGESAVLQAGHALGLNCWLEARLTSAPR